MSDQNHKEKMQERQALQRKKVAELQDPEKGLVLVHTGAGKGKSSSAFGVIVRALGWKQTGSSGTCRGNACFQPCVSNPEIGNGGLETVIFRLE